MRRSGTGSGGGYHTRYHVEKPVRTGSGSHGTNPGYVGQLGQKQGSHATRQGDTGYRGEKMHDRPSFNPVPFGNAVALNSKTAPGQGRTHYHCGSQGTHGATNPGNPRPNSYRDATEGE
jgi:hypothetical protein